MFLGCWTQLDVKTRAECNLGELREVSYLKVSHKAARVLLKSGPLKFASQNVQNDTKSQVQCCLWTANTQEITSDAAIELKQNRMQKGLVGKMTLQKGN